MSMPLDIPAHEAHVVRVFAVVEKRGAPLEDEKVLEALGAQGTLRTEEIELFDLEDLQDMPLSNYLEEGHGVSEAELEGMRGQLDGLTGRVLILPSRAFSGQAMTLRVGDALRLVGRFEEDMAPVSFAPLPAGGAHGSVSGTGVPGEAPRGMRRAALALVALLIAVAVLVLVLVGGS
ncbi:hypothetical protein DDZ14_11275 [Maritimibacter sp. 55A14]|uniref:hypothetical protein n=1 Tax=Maritimibacter sp. 55A14 TaxID=2174844 RepID=UPI000D615E78|nr:hypothetical protein [Maritimibacter sp. 55A14]PWE32301.1 hypothetical protein DDZ14_11275 [Maritimibacter sp. 55A14]